MKRDGEIGHPDVVIGSSITNYDCTFVGTVRPCYSTVAETCRPFAYRQVPRTRRRMQALRPTAPKSTGAVRVLVTGRSTRYMYGSCCTVQSTVVECNVTFWRTVLHCTAPDSRYSLWNTHTARDVVQYGTFTQFRSTVGPRYNDIAYNDILDMTM